MPTRAFAAVLLLLVPLTVEASTKSIAFWHDGGGTSWIGFDGFYLSTDLVLPDGDWADTFELLTGPAAAITPTAGGGSAYSFNVGLLRLYGQGTVVAATSILPFTINLTAPIHDPTWGVFGPGPVSQMPGFTDVVLGAGTLHPTVANSLGVTTGILGGSLFFVVDDFYGNASFARRNATPNFLSGSLTLQTLQVPEPSMLLLTGIGCGALMRNRLRRRRSSSTAPQKRSV